MRQPYTTQPALYFASSVKFLQRKVPVRDIYGVRLQKNFVIFVPSLVSKYFLTFYLRNFAINFTSY